MRLENEFTVPAPPEQAWALLNDIPRVVPCMPGAELTEIVGENEFTPSRAHAASSKACASDSFVTSSFAAHASSSAVTFTAP